MKEEFLGFRDRDRLRDLCRHGRLFETLDLLEQKGTCRLRRTRKWTPLFFAVDRGFHSLVEVLVRYPHSEWDLEKSFLAAVRRNRGDLAALILNTGYDPGNFSIVSVLATGDADLARILLERNPGAGSAFEVSRAILRAPGNVAKLIPILSEFVDDLEDQLYAGLVSLADRGRTRSVLRYLRLGLSSRREGTVLDEREKPICRMTTVEAACASGKISLIRMLKPSPDVDDQERLVDWGHSLSLNHELVQLLLDLDFDLNCSSSGGCRVLDKVLCSPTYGVLMSIHGHERQWALRTIIPNAKWLVDKGARWVPEDSYSYRCFRDNLLLLGEKDGIDLLDCLSNGAALLHEHRSRLLNNPRMRKLFGSALRTRNKRP